MRRVAGLDFGGKLTYAMSTSSSNPPAARGLSFRAKLVLGVCGLVLLTGAAVTWLAHRSAVQATEVLTDTMFREASAHAVDETRAFLDRATPVVDVVHVNSEYLDANRASDHDPVVARLTITGPVDPADNTAQNLPLTTTTPLVTRSGGASPSRSSRPWRISVPS